MVTSETLILNREIAKGGVEISGIPETGSCIILVSDTVNTGTNTIFMACKTKGKPAIITRPVTAVGVTPEVPTITWCEGKRPALKYLISPHDEEDRAYVVTVIAGGPVDDTDLPNQ